MVVGLGNPGAKYEGTRHNIGFDVLHKLAQQSPSVVWKAKFEGQIAEIQIGNERVLLLAPQTYMNLSGRSVKAAAQFFKLFPPEIVVVCDDLNLPLGKVRLKSGGSAGGQKGLQNIIDQLGTPDVPRLRLGVDRPPPQVDPANYVLQKFRQGELDSAHQAIDTASDVIDCWVREGVVMAMNRFNGSGT